jgi:hypothetical protein
MVEFHSKILLQIKTKNKMVIGTVLKTKQVTIGTIGQKKCKVSKVSRRAAL